MADSIAIVPDALGGESMADPPSSGPDSDFSGISDDDFSKKNISTIKPGKLDFREDISPSYQS